MKTAVRESSIQAYEAIQQDGTLNRQQAIIMSVISPGRDYSLQELVSLTGIQINGVSGRVNELKTVKRLEQAPARRCAITGRTVHPVRLPARQSSLFNESING